MRAWVAVGAALALASCSPQGGDTAGVLAEDAAVRVVDVDGLVAAIEAYRGRPLLVNFWAMWCGPCVEELPDLAAAGRRLRAAGGEVLGVSIDLTAPGQELEPVLARLPGFAREHGVDFPILLFGSEDPFGLIQRLDLPGPIPVTLAIDREGEVVRMHEGSATPEEFGELVDLALGSVERR